MKPAFNYPTTFSTQLVDSPEQSAFEFADFDNAQSAGPLRRSPDSTHSALLSDARASHAIDVSGRPYVLNVQLDVITGAILAYHLRSSAPS